MIAKTVTKTVKKYGNSGGIYLPSSWIGGEVTISLITKPPSPERDIPVALGDSMKHVVSILLYGSYTRGENTAESDIDVIIVTDKHADVRIPEELKAMNYDIRILSRDEIKKAVSKDILLRKTLETSRVLFNDSFFDELKSLKMEKSTKDRTILSKSSLDIMRNIFEIGGDNNSLIYPLMMRIKEMLLIKCVLENREYSLRLLKEHLEMKGVSGSDFHRLMSIYRAVRDGKKPKKYEFGEHVLVRLLEILGGLIEYAEKKEEA